MVDIIDTSLEKITKIAQLLTLKGSLLKQRSKLDYAWYTVINYIIYREKLNIS